MNREEVLEGMVVMLLLLLESAKDPKKAYEDMPHMLRFWIMNKNMKRLRERYKFEIKEGMFSTFDWIRAEGVPADEKVCALVAKDEEAQERYPGETMPDVEHKTYRPETGREQSE